MKLQYLWFNYKRIAVTNDLSIFISLLIGAFLGSYHLFPKVIGVANYKRLMAVPNDRSSHTKQTPNLGGLVFFIAVIFAIYFSQQWDYSNVGMSIIPGLLILFFIGLKDDLMVISPVTKIVAQLCAISFILVHPAFQVEVLHGFLGINHIPLVVSIPISAFLMLFIINAFNLIDGIDGLAAMVAIVIFGVVGFLFFLLNLYFFVGVSIVMIGSLAAFLRYNLSSKNKIFMGDTGSLLIGFLISCAVMRIFAMSPILLKQLPFMTENLHLVVLSLLVVPFFDTARVFTVRLLSRKSPFSADRNHVHHLLIDYLHFSHKTASIVLGIFNLAFILLFLFLGANMASAGLFALFIFFVFVFSVFFYRINFSYKNLRRRIRFRSWLDK